MIQILMSKTAQKICKLAAQILNFDAQKCAQKCAKKWVKNHLQNRSILREKNHRRNTST